MHSPPARPVTLADRALGAGLGALCVGATLAVLLVAFFFLSRGAGAELLLRLHLMHAWLACVVAAALLGLATGSEPLPELLAHFWGTATPRRLPLTLALWAAIAAIALAAELASR